MRRTADGGDRRVAAIFGGGRGIGLAIADALHADGAQTVVLDNDSTPDGAGQVTRADSDPTALERHTFMDCDVTDLHAVKSRVADVITEFGRLDTSVAAAGISRPARIEAAPFQDLAQVFRVHLGGHVNVVEATLPHLRASSAGRLILTTSGAGLVGSPRQPMYGAAKMAIAEMTRRLADELSGTSVTVNAFSPTAITRLSAGLLGARPAEVAERLDPAFLRHEAVEVGEFVAELASPDSMVQGRVFLVAGGYLQEFALPHRSRSLHDAAALTERGALGDALRWGLANPNLDDFTVMPTRWFVADEPFRTWESVDVVAR